jgi:hypothetical protein
MKIPDLETAQIARDLSLCANSRDRSRCVARYSLQFRCTPQAVYNAANRAGFSSGRPTRADRGSRRKPVSDAQLAQVAALIHSTHTEKNRIPMSAETAIFLAENNHIIPPETVTPEYLNTWMRRHAIAKSDATRPTPHSRLRSLRPNHVHVFDTSVCAQWYLDNRGGVRLQPRGTALYKNKPANDRAKVIRYLLVDHFSGALFAWYAHTEQVFDLVLVFGPFSAHGRVNHR